MRRVEELITAARVRTRNTDFIYDDSTGETTSGLPDSLFIEFLNDAQEHLQAAIIAQSSREFIESVIVDCVSGQEEYSIPDNLFANNKLVSVEYNSHNNTTDFFPLTQGALRNRDTRSGTPEFFIRRSGKVLLNPIPTQGSIRISYYRTLDKLQQRAGQIDTVTVGSGIVTAITVELATDRPFELNNAEYVCINDRDGNVTARNIPVYGYNSGTGVLNIGSGYTLATGESVTAGDYITIGKYTTTHSKLSDNCERYLKVYAQKRAMSSDSNESDIVEDVELKGIEADILTSYSQEVTEPTLFVVADEEIMD